MVVTHLVDQCHGGRLFLLAGGHVLWNGGDIGLAWFWQAYSVECSSVVTAKAMSCECIEQAGVAADGCPGNKVLLVWHGWQACSVEQGLSGNCKGNAQ